MDFRYDNDDCSTYQPTLWHDEENLSDQWQFTEYKLDTDHVAAVCTASPTEWFCKRRNGDQLIFEKMTIKDLLKNAQVLHSVDENAMEEIFLAKPYKK